MYDVIPIGRSYAGLCSRCSWSAPVEECSFSTPVSEGIGSPAIRRGPGKRGQPRRRPERVQGDRLYDSVTSAVDDVVG